MVMRLKMKGYMMTIKAGELLSRSKKPNTQKYQWIETTGRRFRATVLSLGYSNHPMEVFTAFCGREPDPAAI
jgi:Zn-dependent oligopeptidase